MYIGVTHLSHFSTPINFIMFKKVVLLITVVLLSLSFDSCRRSGCPANQEKTMKKKRTKKSKKSGVLPHKANKKYGIRSR